jgi:hypothetical protein
MDLVQILGNEELANQVKEKLGEDYLIISKKAGDYIPKDKFNEKNSELKALKEQYEAINTKVNDLDKYTKENNELKDLLDKIKQDNETFKSETQKRIDLDKKKFLLRESLIKTGIKDKYLEDAERRFDLDKLEVNDNKVIGFDDRLNPLKETFTEWFETKQFSGTGDPAKGNAPNVGLFTKEQVDKMSEQEIYKNLDKINESMTKWEK